MARKAVRFLCGTISGAILIVIALVISVAGAGHSLIESLRAVINIASTAGFYSPPFEMPAFVSWTAAISGLVLGLSLMLLAAIWAILALKGLLAETAYTRRI